jgi:hypothetical protein
VGIRKQAEGYLTLSAFWAWAEQQGLQCSLIQSNGINSTLTEHKANSLNCLFMWIEISNSPLSLTSATNPPQAKPPP